MMFGRLVALRRFDDQLRFAVPRAKAGRRTVDMMGPPKPEAPLRRKMSVSPAA